MAAINHFPIGNSMEMTTPTAPIENIIFPNNEQFIR